MFKRVEILCSLKGFVPYSWTNVRQRKLTYAGFAKGVF